MTTERNSPCPCGSGRKYKYCCLPGVRIAQRVQKTGGRGSVRLKTAEDLEGIRRAGQLVIQTLRHVEERIRPGLTTAQINEWVHAYTLAHHGRPAPLNYRGFPASVCTSVNEVVCHGIPGPYVLRDGDILNVDVTTLLDGYYADANRTFFVGEPAPDARRVVDVARLCLAAGLEQVRPGKTIGDIGHAVQQCAERAHCSVVRDFIGHGTGFAFHEPPDVPHYGSPGRGIRLQPGMVFTVEPMVNLGQRYVRTLDDGWTAVTRDGSLSAQFEQTIAVTEQGLESMTPYPL